MTTDTGGPAFPTEVLYTANGRDGDDGMTLLDWFAGQAMGGILSSSGALAALAELSSGKSTPAEPTAKLCYKLAEAMIAEKRRREE